ncbi:MAG: LysM peptidoglycan-binding domain-containing protein [Candidatus Hinthialibacter antarcticus]|nr:LysM peptidoglycan-binding domain-containing protein [Candidatus Hinthialibacter antarcticus]
MKFGSFYLLFIRNTLKLIVCILIAASALHSHAIEAIRTADYVNYTQIVFELSRSSYRSQVIPSDVGGAKMLEIKLKDVNAAQFGSNYQLDSKYCPKASFTKAAAGWVQITIPLHEDVDISGIRWHNWSTMLTVSLPLMRPNYDHAPSDEFLRDFRAPKGNQPGGKVVVIDPGHGGFNHGGTGGRYTGATNQRQKEKDVTFDLALRLKALFDKDPQFIAVLTRQGDYLPAPFEFDKDMKTREHLRRASLLHRVKLAKEYHGDIYLSLHLNAPPRVSQQKRSHGFEIYYFGEQHAESLYNNVNKDIEELETLGIDRSNDDNAFLSTVMKDWIPQRSKELAASIAQQMKGLVALRDPYLKSNRFKVISQLNMPSALIEYMFITNPKEHEWVKSSSNRSKLAEATYKGVRDYFFAVDQSVEYSYDDLVKASIEPSAPKKTSAPVYKTTTYRVRSGDTVSTIAKKFGTSASQLRSMNKGVIGSRDRIYAGQKLTVPSSSNTGSSAPSSGAQISYVVKRGDSLDKIANRYNTSITAIRSLNNLRGSLIYPGQTLKIQPGAQRISYAASSPVRYKVRSGDTLYDIAEAHGVSHLSIKRYNNLRSNTIHAGQLITIPK